MAKVRIQAGTTDGDLPSPASSKKPKHDGAVTLLARVLREQGFLGWYQVYNYFFHAGFLGSDRVIAGNGCTDHQSCLITSFAVCLEGPI